jgi:hypothetical protein
MIRRPNHTQAEFMSRVFALAVTAATVVAAGWLTIVSLVSPGQLLPGVDAHVATILSGYTATRSIVLASALVWFAVVRDWRTLGLLLALNGLVQAGDVGVGAVQHDTARMVGPACFAAALVAAALWLRSTSRPAVQ